MLELREIFELEKKNIQESKDKNILFKIFAPFIRADELNKNDRLYPEDVTSRAIENFGGKIKDSKVLSQLNHPLGVHPDIDKVSHIVSKVSYDKKEKRGYAELAVLNTTSGRNLKAIIDSGAKLGVSLRGKGTIGDDKKIQNDFELFGIDIVSSPGFEDATFDKTNIYESYNPEEQKNEPKKITSEQFLKEVNDLLEQGFGSDENARDWDKYLNEHTEAAVKIIKREHESHGDDLTDVFKEERPKENKVLKEKQRLSALYRDAQRGGYRGSFSEWLVKYEKFSPVKPIDKKSLTEDEKNQQRIRQRIFTERIAGKLSKTKKIEE